MNKRNLIDFIVQLLFNDIVEKQTKIRRKNYKKLKKISCDSIWSSHKI